MLCEEQLTDWLVASAKRLRVFFFFYIYINIIFLQDNFPKHPWMICVLIVAGSKQKFTLNHPSIQSMLLPDYIVWWKNCLVWILLINNCIFIIKHWILYHCFIKEASLLRSCLSDFISVINRNALYLFIFILRWPAQSDKPENKRDSKCVPDPRYLQ